MFESTTVPAAEVARPCRPIFNLGRPMSLRPPQNISSLIGRGSPPSAIDVEIVAEMAAALGRAGQKVEKTLEALESAPEVERTARLKAAAKAVHAYFIQRELCGLRKHDDAIRHYRIPRAVLVRLGAD